jgi:Asp-tRNA(Asn)/Glu-tRNA(Gln) amidotransferase B subunit
MHTYPQFVAKFLLNDVMGILKKHKKTVDDLPEIATRAVFPMLYHKEISRQDARAMIEMWVVDPKGCMERYEKWSTGIRSSTE